MTNYIKAQEMTVSVRKVSSTDTIIYLPPRYDINDDITARVDILGSNLVSYEIKGNIVGEIVECEDRLVAYLYGGSRQLHLYRPGHLPLDIDFTIYPDTKYGVKGGETYILSLSSLSIPPVNQKNKYGVGSRILLFQSDTPLNRIVVNGEVWPANGNTVKKLVPYGEYVYEAYDVASQKIKGTVEVEEAIGSKKVKLRFTE